MTHWRDKYKVHPAADVFPMMSDEELNALAKDIKKNGVTHPIVWMDGRHGEKILLDGRNRLEAMERARIPAEGCFKVHHDEKTAVAFIVSSNIHRRHLTKQQQADLIVAAVKAGEKPHQVDEVSKGGRGKVNAVKAKAVEIAEKAGISKPTVERAFERASDHPNAPTALKRKAARAAEKARMAPSNTLEGWRRRYIKAVRVFRADLDARSSRAGELTTALNANGVTQDAEDLYTSVRSMLDLDVDDELPEVELHDLAFARYPAGRRPALISRQSAAGQLPNDTKVPPEEYQVPAKPAAPPAGDDPGKPYLEPVTDDELVRLHILSQEALARGVTAYSIGAQIDLERAIRRSLDLWDGPLGYILDELHRRGFPEPRPPRLTPWDHVDEYTPPTRYGCSITGEPVLLED